MPSKRGPVGDDTVVAARAVVDNLVTADQYQRAPEEQHSNTWVPLPIGVVLVGLLTGGIVLLTRRRRAPVVSAWSDGPATT